VGGGSATDAELSSSPVADWKENGGRVERGVRTCTGDWRTRGRVLGKRGTTYCYSLLSLKIFIEKALCVLLSQPCLWLLYQCRTGNLSITDIRGGL
jgi:hypothetical protein